jgi:thiol-disulfide isomerase/thioredoxin
LVHLLVVALLLSMCAGAPAAARWTVPPAAYNYEPIERCADARAAKLRPNEAVYEICADQMALFQAALDKARAENRLLIVDFGATWCPWCRSLQAQWQTPALLGHNSPALNFTTTFQIVEIGLSTVHAGRRVEIPSGHAVLDLITASGKAVQMRSVPFLAVVDPNDPARTVARNLDDYELERAGQHDPSSIRIFLTEAHDHLRRGMAAPSEPGWLRKKISRAWLRLFGG